MYKTLSEPNLTCFELSNNVAIEITLSKNILNIFIDI